MLVFVYGTLKSGLCNHHYAGKLKSIRPSWTYGRLYHLNEGYPALELPGGSILHEASGDILKDSERSGAPISQLAKPEGDWDRVYGELLELAEPAKTLPKLDWLEDFEHGGEGNLYLRQLIPVNCEGEWIEAWSYHYQLAHGGQRLKKGFWPAV